MREHVFVDVVHEYTCTLVIGETESESGVRHPHEFHLGDCDTLADVSPHLDASYCQGCGYSGRISGAWFFEKMRQQ